MLGGTREILAVWKTVEEKGLSVRETEELAKSTARSVSRETSRRAGRRKDPQLIDLSRQLAAKYSTTVSIVPSGKKGTIRFNYYSMEDLERLVDLLVT
jgi:ParB family chromosome partitioning protein